MVPESVLNELTPLITISDAPGAPKPEFTFNPETVPRKEFIASDLELLAIRCPLTVDEADILFSFAIRFTITHYYHFLYILFFT